MQGLRHLFSSNALQCFGRTGAVETKNGNTNVAFGCLTQNGAATPCTSERGGIRQNAIKTAKTIVNIYCLTHDCHGYTHVAHFPDHAEHLFLEKGTYLWG